MALLLVNAAVEFSLNEISDPLSENMLPPYTLAVLSINCADDFTPKQRLELSKYTAPPLVLAELLLNCTVASLLTSIYYGDSTKNCPTIICCVLLEQHITTKIQMDM